jgi:hypothetical protein
VFVLRGFEGQSTDFVVIRPTELLKRLEKIRGKTKTIQSYLWVAKEKRCWETHDLKTQEQMEIAKACYSNMDRDFSEYLNNWDPIEVINRK